MKLERRVKVKSSIQHTLENTQETRSIDPNVLQRHASNPDDSVWVGASAGSGKTKVLTDRMLRLLLPRANGQMGVEPHKILALTFTKAAASEMALRISKRLSEWAVMSLEGKNGLTENIKSLIGQDPTAMQLDTARKLFAAVIDSAGGLKIMTIHSFCQSILGRFPLEADLPSNFKALEEAQANTYLQTAIQKTIQQANLETSSLLSQAVNNLTYLNNEEQFSDLMRNLISEQNQMQKILEKYFNADGLYTALCQRFGIQPNTQPNDLLKNSCQDNAFNENALRNACAAMSEGTPKTDQKNAITIQLFLDANEDQRIDLYPNYKSVFLTQKNTIQTRIATAKILDSNPNLLDVLHTEANRLLNLQNQMNMAATAALTRDLFIAGNVVLDYYTAQKREQNSLDFDDLILTTLKLLTGKTNTLNTLDATPWIRYKMDQGIDHILVDEAQDTNPEQWEIIQMLCDDFFDTIKTEEEKNRTLFVVGDEKQSIFSFQRASPEKFHTMREWFATKIKHTQGELQKINFETSFRSTPAILDFVDAVFQTPGIKQGLSDLPIQHYSYRKKQAGHVELWPIFESDAQDDFDPWAPPIEIIDSASGAARMANHIGDTIQTWLQTGEILESHDRPIEAGDIMILVKSRTALIDQIVRALKTRDIPVNGVDRMVLNEQLVVQDLCALAQFALLPDDDLTLATILKSPFIGWDEDKLYNFANERQSSLWDNIKNNSDDITIINWLSSLIQQSGKTQAYDFLSSILQKPCPADGISGLRAIKKRLGEECLDPLNEFLNKTLNIDSDKTADLQNFIQTQLFDDAQIKRQMEEANSAVRIMTVHGAKGLQAPIVIMPDTVRTSRSNKPDRILWPQKTGGDFPYYCPTSDDLPEECLNAKSVLQAREDEEYRRLLYVALTRAEDRLYIGGYKNKRPIIDDSWYRYVEKGFDHLHGVQEKEVNGLSIKSFSNPATDKADRQTDKKSQDTQNFETPSWLHSPMPDEASPPRPLTPSRPSGEVEKSLSPLESVKDNRFQRGNITHKLLQILPDVPAHDRAAKAKLYVSQPAHDLSKNVQDSIIEEVMNILNHPNFAPIFGEGSVAEAPITGLLKDNRLVSGQIDRLLVTNDTVFIIDYKSNRPSPDDIKNVPKIYENQMKTYADIMREIYPKHDIKTALLWTDKCQLMEIDVS